MSLLTKKLRQQWDSDGFIRIKNFFNPLKVEKLSFYLDEIASWDISCDQWMMWFEKTYKNRRILSRVENFLDFHNELNKLLFSEQGINLILKELLGEKPVLFKERIIFKNPDSAGYQPHQDVYNPFYAMPKREVYAVVSVMVDGADETNGCVYFSPGKHKEGILKKDERGVMYSEIYKDFNWKPMIAAAGDLVIFDNHVPHYSKMNKSNVQRRIIYLSYQKESTVGLTRKEYYLKKRLIAPPEGINPNIFSLKKQNDIVFRE